MAISSLELRHIIESAFLPLRARCSTTAQGEMKVEVFDPATGLNTVYGGVSMASLNTSRAISDLIAKVRGQLCPSVARGHVRRASM